MPVESRRCRVCRCPEDWHRHLTRPGDTRCGTCGYLACPEYLPPGSTNRLTADQLRTQQIAEHRQMLNVIALMRFANTRQRIAAARIPIQRPRRTR